MKKILILGLIIISSLILTGCAQKKNEQTTSTQENKGNIFDSIKDAMARSLSLKCEYDSPNGKVTAYVKGQAIMIEGSWKDKSNNESIIKDNKLWNWDKDKKEGIILPLNTQEQNKAFNPDDIINNLEQQKQNCRVAVVADSVFTPPTDVKFQDLGQLMEKLSNPSIPNLPVLPSENP